MPKYNINALKTIYYHITNLEAGSIEEAEQMVFHEKLPQELETYAVDWEPLEATEIMEVK